MIKRIIYLALFAALLLGGAVLYLKLQPEQEEITVERSRISEIRTLARLCSVEVYNETPVLDTIGEKVLIGMMKQWGSIGFDLERMEVDESGDTVTVVLPPAVIELREATEPHSWEVIDTKNIGPLGMLRSDKLTLAEENRLKANVRRRAVSDLYRNGTVRRARREAAQSLAEMLTALYRKPARVIIPAS